MRSTLMMIGAAALFAGALTAGFVTPARAEPRGFAVQVQLFDLPPVFGTQPRYDDRRDEGPRYAPQYEDTKPREGEPRAWERRRANREARDHARIEEAAQREAERIEQEREARRAWRRDHRGEYRGDESRGGEYRGDQRFDELRERYRRE